MLRLMLTRLHFSLCQAAIMFKAKLLFVNSICATIKSFFSHFSLCRERLVKEGSTRGRERGRERVKTIEKLRSVDGYRRDWVDVCAPKENRQSL